MPAVKCFVCGQVGCKTSTCPKGDPAAQKEHADRKAERNNPELSPEVFPNFLGTVVYDLPHADEPSERACIAVAPVLPQTVFAAGLGETWRQGDTYIPSPMMMMTEYYQITPTREPW